MGNANLSGGLYADRPATPTVGMIYAASDRLLVSVCIEAGAWLELPGEVRGEGTLAARPATPNRGDAFAVTSGPSVGNRALCFVPGTWDELPAGFTVEDLLSLSQTVAGVTTTSIGAVPTSRTVNSHALSSNVALTATDVGAISSTIIRATMATFPDPDTLAEGTIVMMTDESSFVGMVAKRPHLEANGSRRNFYIQLQTAAFAWKYTTGSNTTANYLGRYDPIFNKVYAITSTSDVPNCLIGTTTTTGGLSTAQRIGKPLASYLAAGQALTSGQPLTWNASGQLIGWNALSTTPPVGYLAVGAGFLPLAEGNTVGNGFVSYLPFITAA